MSLTFDQLKKRVGKNLRYYDDTDGWKTNRDVTETDIGEYINEIYREDVFPMFVTQYPQDFKQTSYADSHIATGTVDAASTSTTLVATTSIFANSMVGLTVYNSTDDETAIIDAYTSATTVTLDTTIGDTWDGDTIYVLGQEFTFGGDSTDLYVLETVGVKYRSTDDFYRQAMPRLKEDYFQVGNEVGLEVSPNYYLTTVTVSGTLTKAVGLIPGFSEKVDKGLQITYVRKPAELTNSGDTMTLPVDTPVIYGATQRAYEKKEEFNEAGYWLTRYENEMKKAITRYRPMSSRKQTPISVPRRFANTFYRRR